RLLKTRQMAAGDMPRLVREHADQLVRCLGAHYQAGVHEFVLSAGDEGIDLLVLDGIDVHRARLEPRRLPDRGHHRPNVGLDFGVADIALCRRASLAESNGRRQNDCREAGKLYGHKRCFRLTTGSAAATSPGAAPRAARSPSGPDGPVPAAERHRAMPVPEVALSRQWRVMPAGLLPLLLSAPRPRGDAALMT